MMQFLLSLQKTRDETHTVIMRWGTGPEVGWKWKWSFQIPSKVATCPINSQSLEDTQDEYILQSLEDTQVEYISQKYT